MSCKALNNALDREPQQLETQSEDITKLIVTNLKNNCQVSQLLKK